MNHSTTLKAYRFTSRISMTSFFSDDIELFRCDRILPPEVLLLGLRSSSTKSSTYIEIAYQIYYNSELTFEF